MFYQEFIRLCNKVGVAPSRVAEAVGLKKSTVTRWKNGGMPTDATMARLADYFGVPTAQLRGEVSDEVHFDDFTYAMYAESRELTPANKKLLLEMAKFFKEQQKKGE